MTNRWTSLILAACASLATAPLVANDVAPHSALAKAASWSPPPAAGVWAGLQAWLKDRPLDDKLRGEIAALWPATDKPLSGAELHERLLNTLALAEPRAKQLVELCSGPRQSVALPDISVLGDQALPPLVRSNLRLQYGRWLVHERLLDEATVQLTPLKPQDVVDPASLLFYQGVVHHKLLNKEPGLEVLGRLLENEAQTPLRYRSVALLMSADLMGLKDESLDHIARRMDDIRRRLDLGHAGPKVRAVEDGVVASLDKLIKEMEDEQARRDAAAAAGQGNSPRDNIRSNSPAPDSVPIGGKGAGSVAKKNLGKKSGWGDLPPKEREEAMQQIGKEFPSHYRDVIEQYFRKIASDGDRER